MILGYVRVSSDGQIKGTSLAEQERVIRAIGVAKGLTGEFDVSIYKDEAVSGSIPLRRRPAGKRLLDAAQRGDVIVAKTLDRAFRDARDALDVFEHCRAAGIDLVVYDLGHESVTKDGVSKMIFTILGAVAEMERGRIRDRVTTGRKAKAAKGGHVGGLPRYGYRVVGEGKDARIEVDPDEQEIVAKVREVAASTSLSEATRQLAALGIVNRVGQPFQKTQVARIACR